MSFFAGSVACIRRGLGGPVLLRPRLVGAAAHDATSSHPARSVSKETRLVILSIIGTLVVVGVLQNMRTVTIRFILWEMGVPLSLFLLFVVGLGFIAGLFWRRR